MDRRTFCGTAAAGVAGSLVGCVGTTTDADPETGTRSNPATETRSGTTTPARPHDLYVMNYTTTTELATVRVVDAGGTPVVDSRYELPSERGIEFADIGAWETTYTVELTVDDTALEPVTWETPSCAGNEEAPQGSRNGYVRVRDDGDGFRAALAVDDCDAILAPEYPTGPAEGFRVEE